MDKCNLGLKKDTEFVVDDETVARYLNIKMGELTNFLGTDAVRIIFNNSAKTINEFKAQNPATGIALGGELQVENEIYKQGATILIYTLEEIQARNEVNNQAIKQCEQDFKIRNDDFIKKHKISVITSKERKHAFAALLNHLKI